MNHQELYGLGFIMKDPTGSILDPDEVPTVEEVDAAEYVFTEGSFQVVLPGDIVDDLDMEDVVRGLVRAANIPTLEDGLTQLFGSKTVILFDEEPKWTPDPPPKPEVQLPPIARKPAPKRFKPK